MRSKLTAVIWPQPEGGAPFQLTVVTNTYSCLQQSEYTPNSFDAVLLAYSLKYSKH